MSAAPSVREAALQFAAAGYQLVAWPAWNPDRKPRPGFVKGPHGASAKDWGLRPADPAKIRETHSIGVNHALSGTCSLDLDDLERSKIVLEFLGVDLDQLRAAALVWRGSPERLKLLFRAPEPPLGVFKFTAKGRTVLELRGAEAGKQAQDVLPPSIHPAADGSETGRYEQLSPLIRRDDLPHLPPPLLALWRDPAALEPVLRHILGEPLEAPRLAVKQPGEALRVIDAYNAQHDVGAILERNGYQPHPGRRWLRPSSETGVPGVVALPPDFRRVYSHGGGPLAGRLPHDAFDLFKILEHGGDQTAAIKAAAAELGLSGAKRTAVPAALPARAEGTAAAATPDAPAWRLRRAEVNLGVLRPQRWVIEGFFPDEEQHTLAGQPGVGKSTAMGGLALVVAGYGRELGTDLSNDRPRRVLIVTEHAAQYERLFFAYCRRYRLPPDEVADRVRLYHAARLTLGEIQLELAHVIAEAAEAGADKPLVIVDTAAASLALEDENDNAEVSATLAELKRVVLDTGAPCWVIAHAAKALGRNDAEITPRGASAFIGDAHGTASIFRDEALPEWIFLRSLKCRAVRAFDEVAVQTFVEWHEAVDERGVIQRVGIRLGVPRKGGEAQRKSVAAEHAEAAREADEAALRREAELWALELIRRRGCAGIYSGSGPCARPAAIPADAAITAAALKGAVRRSSSTVQELLEHLREWATTGALDLEPVGAWYMLREKTGNTDVSPPPSRIPRGFPEDSPKIPEAAGKGGRGGARTGGLQSPSAPLPPSSPTVSLRGGGGTREGAGALPRGAA